MGSAIREQTSRVVAISVFLIKLSVVVGIPQASFAQYTFEVTTVDAVDAVADVGLHSAIAVNPKNNHVHIAYYDATNGELKHAYLNESGNWITETVDSSPSVGGNAIAIHIDRKGRAHFAYSDVVNGALKYAKKTGTSWSIQTIDTGNYPFALALSISADRQGHPYVAYTEGQELKLAFEDRSTVYPYSWALVPFVRQNGISVRTSSGAQLVIDQPSVFPPPNVHVVFHDSMFNQLRRLSYSVANGDWSEETIGDFNTNDRVHSLSSVLRDGTHHLSYIVGTSFGVPPPHPPSRLYYLANTGSSWSTPESVDLSDPYFPESIYFSAMVAVDSNGSPIILLRGGDVMSPWYVKKNGSWTGETIYESDWEWYGEEYLSLAVDPCNNLHVSFYESQNNHLLYDHGVLDSNPGSCDPEGSPFYAGSSGGGYYKSRCRAVFTSWTELPKLVCDSFWHIAAEAHHQEEEDVDACPTSGPCCYGCEHFSRSSSSSHAGPPYHSEMYKEFGRVLLSIAGEEVADTSLSQLRNLFAEVPTGTYFNKEMKEFILQKTEGSKKLTPRLVETLARGLNAMELDLSVPELQPATVKSGRYSAVDFQGVAWLVFKNLAKGGKATLKIENDIDLLQSIRGYAPGWPAGKYEFEFTGSLEESGYIDITFNFAGLNYRDVRGMRIYELHGKSYRNVTLHVDPLRRVITGRTKKLSSYVIMTPILE